MINIHVKELMKEFDSKLVNIARVNTEDGRTFSLSVSMQISEDSKQNEKCGVPVHPFNTMRSPVECDTSGCMNSSPDSERSGILNTPEFVSNVACDVDDFLNSFNDPAFRLQSPSTVANITEGITDEAECESIADSDCDTIGVEYFVVDELVGKRFNDKTQKYEFLLRPKRYIPKNEIIWNPIDNLDNFDISLLEHSRLYIEVPDSLKKQEKRKRSVLQDKFLSEVNLPSGKKTDYLPSSAGDLRNANFDKMYPTYICSGSTDNTLDVEMENISANFEELVPVVPVLIDSQPVDPPIFHESEVEQKKRRPPRQRAEKAVYLYECADCDFKITLKRKMMQHVRIHLPQHIKTNNLRGSQRRKLEDTHNSKHPIRFHRNKTKLADKPNNLEERSSTNSESTKRRKVNNEKSSKTVPKKKNSKEDENCPKTSKGVIFQQELKNMENDSISLPEDRLNQTDENSEEIFYSLETKYKGNRGCAVVEDVLEKENELVGKRRTVLKLKRLKSKELVNGKVNARQTRKRSNSKIENETDNAQNKVSKLSCDDPVQLGTGVPDEHSKELSHPGSNHDHAGRGNQLPEQTPTLLPKKTESELPISFPVSIPLSVLENSSIDVEMLRRRLLTKIEGENSITHEKLSLAISAVVEIPPSNPRADFTNVDLVSPPRVNVPTEFFPSCSLQSKVMEDSSIVHSGDATTDEEVILSIVNRMLNILDSESDEKSKDATDENNSIELNQRLHNPSCEKGSIESDESCKDASVDTSTPLASQELSLPTVFTNVGNIEKSLKNDDGSANSASQDVRFLKCTFCDFVAVGYTKYKEHTIRNHTDKFKRCLFCPRSLMSESSMIRHEREYHAEYLPFVLLSRVICSNSSTN